MCPFTMSWAFVNLWAIYFENNEYRDLMFIRRLDRFLIRLTRHGTE